MDVYSQDERRAHGTGFVGIGAESDDAIDNLEVYEALINPREADQRGGQSGPGMMPPMMGMAGGGAGAVGAGGAGAGLSTAATNVAAASVVGRAAPVTMPGSAPTLGGPAAASAGLGVGTAAGLGAGPGGSGGRKPDSFGDVPPGGLAAAQAPEEPKAEEVPGDRQPSPSTPSVLGSGQGVTAVDPAEVDRVAKEWSGLAQEMATIGAAASGLQASLEDFGLVRQPAGPYGEMTTGIQQLAGGASKEFDEIATGLSYGAQAYRDHEAAAAATARSAQ